ncbi:hypothetical protein OV079_06790 [Nannocystis pusilla]|uniref:Uncharacterized protein n=1 Tax=Nannocystis pusilla TaxID=889268 RepID=A0A9X3ETN8_9BACT|nr:hypothetical protein [Nannocystis pusilla]MCY1005283.1 hypothetical protein [Nannocystis pusilla]
MVVAALVSVALLLQPPAGLDRQGLGVIVSLLLVSSALFLTASIAAMRLKRKRVQCDPGGCALRF